MNTQYGYSEYRFQKINPTKYSRLEYVEMDKESEFEWYCERNQVVKFEDTFYLFKGAFEKLSPSKETAKSYICLKHGRKEYRRITLN